MKKTKKIKKVGVKEQLTSMPTKKDKDPNFLSDEELEDLELEKEKETIKALAVYSKTGGYVRTYDVKNHGLKFKDLATMFASKIKGDVRKV